MIKSKNLDGFKKLLTEYYAECANCETYPNVKSINEKWERYQRDSEVWISLDTECVWASVAYGLRRKPKTQMINGHEVVAPRYDMPEHREDIIVMNCFNKRGIEVINFSAKTMRDVISWGWFSIANEDNALAYANAHRDNKND